MNAEVKTSATAATPYDFAPNANPAYTWGPGGNSRFGGAPPQGFTFPKSQFASGYQYLGFLSNEDLPVPIKGDGIHLIYPMMIARSALFLDISNPMAPKLFPPEQCFMSYGTDQLYPCDLHKLGETSDPEIETLFRREDQLIYQPTYVSRRAITVEDYEDANASHPSWIQHPEVPICPRTQEPMQFLGMLGTGQPPVPSALVDRARAALDKYTFEDYFYGLMFWGGNWPAYAFYHPEGQSLSIHPQAT